MKAHNIKFGTCWLNLVPYNASPLHIKYAKYKIHQKTMFLNYSNQRVDFEESATFTEMILILECHFQIFGSMVLSCVDPQLIRKGLMFSHFDLYFKPCRPLTCKSFLTWTFQNAQQYNCGHYTNVLVTD